MQDPAYDHYHSQSEVDFSLLGDIQHQISGRAWLTNNYWFARDVTAAMLVVKNKSISLLWELNSIFM